MNWFTKRASEPSSWGGLGLLVAGLGEIFKINEAPVIVQAAGQIAEQVATVGFSWPGLAMAGLGILATFLGDPGTKAKEVIDADRPG